MTRSTTLFSKRPQAGVAKTRLSPALAPPDAARLAQAMLLDSAQRLAAAFDLKPRLALAEEEDLDWFAQHVPWIPQRCVQVGPGLGERLAHHFGTLGKGDSAVVIGSDQPLVPIEHMRQAHVFLEGGADLVLGPDQGGGYYLVGLRRSCPELFLDVPMSTQGMCQATQALACKLGLKVELLPAQLDVDTGADLQLLRRRIAADPDYAQRRAPRTVAIMKRLETTLAT